jgi:hypothetical protein
VVHVLDAAAGKGAVAVTDREVRTLVLLAILLLVLWKVQPEE